MKPNEMNTKLELCLRQALSNRNTKRNILRYLYWYYEQSIRTITSYCRIFHAIRLLMYNMISAQVTETMETNAILIPKTVLSFDSF